MTRQHVDRPWIRFFASTLLAAAAAVGMSWLPAATAQTLPPVEEAGVEGGLAVWVGSDLKPAEWAEALSSFHTDRGMLVLGLQSDTKVVAATRAELALLNLYGPVSVDTLPAQAQRSLPMIDDSVNLLVVASRSEISHDEVLRVLAPLGAALVDKGGTWTKITKPWPADIDEWTHYLHDASNNAVAHDQRVGPPRHLQWQCGPRWSRHHDHMASVSAMVSARGRVFCFLDEGSRVSPQLPPDWKLIARDAFNGVFLWKHSIERWHDNLWPLKSGPANLPRRLVAQNEEVYATLGIQAPVTALRAATGETLRQYAGTSGAEEILYNGVLLVLANRTPLDLDADLEDDPEEGKSRDGRTTYSPTMGRIWSGVRSRRWTHGDRLILAFDAESGRRLWDKASRVIPLTLAADDDNAYYHDGDKIVALELANGRHRWTTEPVPVWQGLDGQGLQSWFAPSLVAHGGTILFAGGEKIHMSYVGWGSEDIGEDTMTAFSAKTGEELWTADHPYSGYNSPEDLLVASGKVWAGATAKGGADGRYIGRDLSDGEIKNEFPPTVKTFWFHHRCYRAKATDNYILCSRTGIELVDLATGQWNTNHWVRGGCLYGIMPSNGLIYSPPHPCACYPEAKLHGFTALAGSRVQGRGSRVNGLGSRVEGPDSRAKERLERGPAYGSSYIPPSAIPLPPSKAWPTYRHDPARSERSSSDISPSLRPQWSVRVGEGLTQPIMADGRLFIAEVDRHAVHAIDAGSGEKLWSYTAGGRIDSPPTYDRGHLLFGSADGYVYSLRASDGALAWRFRAAPVDHRLVAFDQVESIWPVHGSVLVQDGVVSVMAGRSMYLDGGLRFCRLDVETGRLLSEKVLDDRDPETGENMQVHVKGLTMPVALPDILSSDGEHLFMRSQAMDLEGNRLGFGPGEGEYDHLFAAFGFTDDSWFHRSYWLYGDGFLGGAGGYTRNGRAKPGGRILVNNDTTVFGYGRKQQYYRWTSVMEYQLFAAAKPGGDSGSPRTKPGRGKSSVAYRWTRDVAMMVRAMALAGDTLFIAGPADLVDEETSFQNFPDESVQKQLALQDAALKGESGALLQAVHADTGEILAEYQLDSPPVFDGLIVADGRVFLSTMDGRLLAFAEP